MIHKSNVDATEFSLSFSELCGRRFLFGDLSGIFFLFFFSPFWKGSLFAKSDTARPHRSCVYSAGCAEAFRGARVNVARVRARRRAVRACTRECVGACNAREMRRTTIQILLLLLREQSPVNRPPRHNVSIQVRSAVLNRSGFTPREDLEKAPHTRARNQRRPPSVLRCASRKFTYEQFTA